MYTLMLFLGGYFYITNSLKWRVKTHSQPFVLNKEIRLENHFSDYIQQTISQVDHEWKIIMWRQSNKKAFTKMKTWKNN